jgi:hypothetical protein
MRIFFKNRNIPATLLLVFMLSGVMFQASGCHTTREQRHAYKMQRRSAKEGAKEHEALIKAHYDHQAEITKKMMKEMKKENKRLKKNRKRSFWDRLFHNKCR